MVKRIGRIYLYFLLKKIHGLETELILPTYESSYPNDVLVSIGFQRPNFKFYGKDYKKRVAVIKQPNTV